MVYLDEGNHGIKACLLTNENFFWMVLCLMGMTLRTELSGVTSFVRALSLTDGCYDRLLDFLHSPALDIEKLTQIWVQLVLKLFPKPFRINEHLVLLGDGIKIAKEGKKMPAVKHLHQDSDSNSKAEYVMGHSCQAISLLVNAIGTFFAVPLTWPGENQTAVTSNSWYTFCSDSAGIFCE